MFDYVRRCRRRCSCCCIHFVVISSWTIRRGASSKAGADLDATDSDGCTALEVCNDESVMLLLTQALEAAEEAGGSSESSPPSTKRSESQTTVAGSERRKGARGAGLREGDKKKAGASGSSKSLVATTTTTAGKAATSAKVEEEEEDEPEEIDPLHRTGGVAGTEDGAAGDAVMVKEEPAVLDLPEDRSRMVRRVFIFCKGGGRKRVVDNDFTAFFLTRHILSMQLFLCMGSEVTNATMPSSVCCFSLVPRNFESFLCGEKVTLCLSYPVRGHEAFFR